MYKFEKIVPFHSEIWKFNVCLDFDSVIERCYLYQKDHAKTVIISNSGGYQSKYALINTFGEYFGDIGHQLRYCFENIEKELGLYYNISNWWLNINKKHDYNLLHDHPGSSISGVLYIKCEQQSGGIVFQNALGVASYPVKNHPGSKFRHKINPVQGDFIIFPSYLAHFVEQNLSDEDRISISFNFTEI
jgi:uncharacterized protein (TIGR02466 family)